LTFKYIPVSNRDANDKNIGIPIFLSESPAMTVQQSKGQQVIITALTENHLDNPDYTPARLLDAMIERLGLKNDAAIARTLELPPAAVSKLRRRQASITAALLVRMHDITGWSISDLRALMGLKSQFQTL
jgi:plasmid maintenance system antidote protein VapI